MTEITRQLEWKIRQADPDKVLCDGRSRTSLGGMVEGGSDLSMWTEMTETEADKLIAENEAKEAENHEE